jgi:hypothetical protein
MTSAMTAGTQAASFNLVAILIGFPYLPVILTAKGFIAFNPSASMKSMKLGGLRLPAPSLLDIHRAWSSIFNSRLWSSLTVNL